jgi:hypothetical protein
MSLSQGLTRVKRYGQELSSRSGRLQTVFSWAKVRERGLACRILFSQDLKECGAVVFCPAEATISLRYGTDEEERVQSCVS